MDLLAGSGDTLLVAVTFGKALTAHSGTGAARLCHKDWQVK